MSSPARLRLVLLCDGGRQAVVYQDRLPLAAFLVPRALEPARLEQLRLASHHEHPRQLNTEPTGRALSAHCAPSHP